MDISLFDYHLPKELIAQYPPHRRGQSRLLIYDRRTGERTHTKFSSLPEFVGRGDALVVNNTKVFKARIWGERATGGKIEVFLVRPLINPEAEDWEALVSPSRRLKSGEAIQFGSGRHVTLVEYFGSGKWTVRFKSAGHRKKIVSEFGHVPLPHYISRPDQPEDVRRYQTVFADPHKVGAVAAPTAGFHFTKKTLDSIRSRGTKIVEVTLHVGPGTFKPVKTDRIEDHTVDPEFAELSPESAERLNEVRSQGGRIFAVGTTSVRTLESSIDAVGNFVPRAGLVDLYIRPGFKFRGVDHLVTNFHLPKSSLLILVSAFMGREQALELYREAIRERYRFYSYGDAMLIL